jgi:hypothetical protein
MTKINCLMSQRHWSLTMICHNGTLLGFCIVQIINAMSNKQPLISGALLGLPQALKTLLLQHTMIGKTNMVATGRLSQTFGFALITLSTIWRAPMDTWLASNTWCLAHFEWHARIYFYHKMRALSSKIVHPCHLAICSSCLIYLRPLSLITLAYPI